jgi:hypothetical protein
LFPLTNKGDYLVNERSKRAITTRIRAAQLNPELPEQPDYLVDDEANKVAQLGILPIPLRHVYLLLLEFAKDPNITPEGLFFAREQFRNLLRETFHLKDTSYTEEEFAICRQWTVWVVAHEVEKEEVMYIPV